MRYSDMLMQGTFAVLNKAVIKECGPSVAILLSFLCDKANMCGNRFYYQIERIMDDTCLGEKTIQAAMNVLKAKGIVAVEKIGLPAKNYYTLDNDVLDRFIQSLPKAGTSTLPEGGTKEINLSVVSSSIKDKPDTTDTKDTTGHKYGTYKNVLMTDAQMTALKDEFPDWEQRIEAVSAYCEAHGKTYKNYLAAIRTWARKDKKPVEDLSARYDHVY